MFSLDGMTLTHPINYFDNKYSLKTFYFMIISNNINEKIFDKNYIEISVHYALTN